MGRKCKCTICKAELNTDTAFLWTHRTEKTEKRFYYCSEEEYMNYIKIKAIENDRKRRMNDCINNIIGYINKNTLLFSAEKEWLNVDYALEAIENNALWISDLLRRKGFDMWSNEYNLIKYLSAVINNNLKNWINEIKQTMELEEYKSGVVDVNHEEHKAKSFQKRKNKCLDDFE